jgi:hypothetical protein
VIGAEQVLPGSKEGVGKEREGVGAGRRNCPNNARTCEQMNKKFYKKDRLIEKCQH